MRVCASFAEGAGDVSNRKLFRIIALCSFVVAVTFSLAMDKYEGRRLPIFLFIFLAGLPVGYVVSWILSALHWVAFDGSDGDGLGLVPFVGKVLSLPFLPFLWLWRWNRRRREARRYELGRVDRERAAAQAQERDFWNSPEGQKVRAAQLLAETEKAKAETLAQIRLAETSGLAGIARDVAQEEEERQRRQLEELKRI